MILSKVAVLALRGLALAHPSARRPLDLCADHLKKRGVNERARARRAAIIEANKRHLFFPRDTETTVNKTHHSSLKVSLNTPESGLFSANPVCILAPKGEVGPFWVKGELIRSDVSDGEPCVPIILDGQFIDINTCEPIKYLYCDVWNCNSTGIYSGVQSDSNGNGDDALNLNKTFLHGIQKTDSDGVAQFKKLFPGHYSDRATHIYVIAHTNAHVLPNNTLTGGHISHIGQLFFDQDLITQVEDTYPYNTSTVAITKNIDDHVVQVETADSTSDLFFEYSLLGDSIGDGIFGWVTLGINTTASHDSDASYAAYLTKNGGVKNGDSTF